MSTILGVSGLYHDSAAALVMDGRVVAAAEEERFSRKKHDASLPLSVIQWLAEEHLVGGALDSVVFYERPLTKLDRVLKSGRGTLRNFAFSRRAFGVFAKEKLFVEATLGDALSNAGVSWDGRLLYADHHLSHAASAFYPSQFEEAAVLCLDGVGEWASSSIHHGRGSSLDLLEEGSYPHSFGLFYATLTQIAGFKVNSGEYKLMGLAPYGKPRFVKMLKEHVISVDEDGAVTLDMGYFSYLNGSQMASEKLADLLWGGPLSVPMTTESGEPTELACDIAASAQALCNEVLLRSAMHASRITGSRNLALAGGVALNSVAVGYILESGEIDKVFVQPAASDAGGALGCALQLSAQRGELVRDHVLANRDAMCGSFLSYTITSSEADSVVRKHALRTRHLTVKEMDMEVARLIAEGSIVGVARGRAEFGPRALGNRSILASATDTDMQTRLNVAVKKRESFRPFAPAVLEEDAEKWFMYPYGDQHMTTVAHMRPDRTLITASPTGVFARVRLPRSDIPAVTHLDYTARVQLVPASHPLSGILEGVRELSGLSVVVNTSFNRRGEPIVRTAQEAYECFMRTDIDALVLGDHLVLKSENRHPEAEVPALEPELD